MQLLKSALCLIALSATPALADDAMGMMKMMKGGEVVAIMPDGHMGTMMMKPDDKMMGDMMKMAKPLDHCVMIMTGDDGKTYVVDTSTPEAMKACEKMAK
ncbi:hypothetical protein [Mesorhizobium sp. LjNodule214]|uniref:hypothetical protein n=1 Tax=Mesorhizobium sp. LjNodule214 TaxID=3342252 RepID=UPI003ED06DF2